MALTATLDLTVSPITLTVRSDRRKVFGTITVLGESVPFTGQFPVSVADTTGRSWRLVSDDGTTAVFTGG